MIGLSWCSGDPKHCAVGHSNISGDFFDVIIIIIIKPLLKSKLTVTTRYNHTIMTHIPNKLPRRTAGADPGIHQGGGGHCGERKPAAGEKKFSPPDYCM